MEFDENGDVVNYNKPVSKFDEPGAANKNDAYLKFLIDNDISFNLDFDRIYFDIETILADGSRAVPKVDDPNTWVVAIQWKRPGSKVQIWTLLRYKPFID